MKHFLLVFPLFLFSPCTCVYIKDEVQSTKPPLQVEELPWLTFFDRKSTADDFQPKARSQSQRNTVNLVSHSTLCPPGETGQFPYPPDCKRFINCWKGRGAIQVCAPGTLFNPETLECDFPGKVKCEDSFGGFGDNHPMPTGERYVRFPHQRPQIIHNPRIARKNQNEESQPDSIPAKPYPGRPPYFGASHLKPPTRPGNQTQGREIRPQCALGATGLYPHPYDCTKFLKCWSGNTFIQNCGPGTFFNPLISACDHPRNVPCAHEENLEPAIPDESEIPAEDNYLPEESVQHESYQKIVPAIKAPSKKGGKQTIKPDPESPNYEDESVTGTSTPKTEVEDLEPPVVAQTETNLANRKPKVINIGSQQNQFANGKEPAPYLTPPEFDVYGNLINSDNTNQAKLGVQPGQSGYPNKPKVQNPSSYPSNPYLISYPPQGPYSKFETGNQQKLDYAEQTKNYYGYMLNKKHIAHQHPVHPYKQHPVHPHHPHHAHHPHGGPPTWLVPPPMQSHFFPQYAPYHQFFPTADGNSPQTTFSTPHMMHIPYYPTYIYEGEMCKMPAKTAGNKQEPSAPKCEPGFAFYGPNQNGKPSAFPQSGYNPYLVPSGTDQTQKGSSGVYTGYPQQPGSNSQFQPSSSGTEQKGPNNVYSGYPQQPGNNPQFQPSSPGLDQTQKGSNGVYLGYPQQPESNPHFQPIYNRPQNQNTKTPQGNDYSPQVQINLTPGSPNLHGSSHQRPGSTIVPTDNHQATRPTSQGGYYVPQTSNNFGQSAYNPQFSTNYPKQPENTNLNPYYPTGSYTPQNNNQNPNGLTSQSNKPGTQYQPYLFFYYPVNSNLYPYYPSYYPNQNSQTSPKQPQTPPNTPEISKSDTQGQTIVPDPFPSGNTNVNTHYKPAFVNSGSPSNPVSPQQSLGGPVEVPGTFDNQHYHPVTTTEKNIGSQYPSGTVLIGGSSQGSQPDGQVPVPDPFDTKNYVVIPGSFVTTEKSPEYRPVYVPNPTPEIQGQVEEPSPFDNKNQISKADIYPVKGDENIHGTPYYPHYNPGSGYNSNIKSPEPSPEETTFPPFPGHTNKKPSGNIKTGYKSGSQKEYLLGKIDVRTKETDSEGLEDAENITTTVPPVNKRGSEKVDEAVIKKPSYTLPDKYSQPEGTKPEQTIEPEADVDTTPEPKKQVKKPYVKVKQTPPNGQILRLRNGASHLDGYLEMKDSKSKWGLVCDYPGQWGIAEATAACRELGFIRGAELSWQGYPIKSDSEDLRVAVSRINCTGKETSLSECKVSYNDTEECDVGRNAVGLRCFDNLASHCQPGEILYNQHCYKLHGKENPDDPWIKTEKASEECKKYGGKLVDITSQYENDFISEWLIKKHPDVTAVATGGIGISVLGRPMWLWEGTTDPMVYERWWSGWSGDQGVPKGSINGPLCIVLRKTFSCVDDDEAQKNAEAGNDEETCSADYFFWDVEDCEQLRTSVFICERPMDDIGCVVGNGEGYVGTANTTASGLPCLPWDHPKVVEGLARRGAAQERSSRLVGHNYCRNLGNPDRHPWCFVEGRGNSEYCAIPQCWDSVSGSYSRSSGSLSSCDPNHFECRQGECIKKEWVCDGQKDCPNGRDEEACTVFIQEFKTERNKKMRGRGNERWPNVNENICAKLCLENKNFKCKSFSYNYRDKDCLLSDTNLGLSGEVAAARGWVYHERITDSVKCTLENGFFGCQTGKCINISNVCDGKRNCQDGSDERDCERLGYRIRLNGSEDGHRGRVEVKILGKWGVICDDMFDMRDAEVVCRELGFKLGAAEVLKHSEFPVEKPLFLVDHLDCLGNETSIRECKFPGWGKHNCGPEEVVGVSCRVPGIDCPEGHWQCRRSKECISLAYLCDELKDCDDGTDEDKLMCGSPTQIRLAGGPNATSGRLEIRRYDIWGTVCHDDFSVEAGNSVCSLLGFNGPSVVKKSAYFGPGDGPIWLDSGLCFVNETNLEECTKHIGFQNNCKHNEDVSLICSQQDFNQKSAAIKPIAASSADDEGKRSEEKLRQVLISECSGKPKPKPKILHDKYEKVVGGSDVAREALPWQASVRVRSGSGKSVHWCGAIVISSYHVLTAGHCLRDYNKAAYFIRVGDYDTKVADPHEREFGIEHLYMHPNFSKSINLNNDIGLVKIKGEIPLGEHIKPACLAPAVDMYVPGTNCSVSGWGSVSANAAGYARTLRRAFVPILEPSVCRAPFVYGESLSDGMFCAGHLDGGVDSCQGDSGGPLMCQFEGREYLFGITSWGHGCGRANKPGVYTNVAFYTDWIQQKIQSSLS